MIDAHFEPEQRICNVAIKKIEIKRFAIVFVFFAA